MSKETVELGLPLLAFQRTKSLPKTKERIAESGCVADKLGVSQQGQGLFRATAACAL
jgi:hypothetical protein